MRVKKIDNDSTKALNTTVVYMCDCYIDGVYENGKAIVQAILKA